MGEKGANYSWDGPKVKHATYDDELRVEAKRRLKSLIRQSKDPEFIREYKRVLRLSIPTNNEWLARSFGKLALVGAGALAAVAGLCKIAEILEAYQR